MTDSTGSTRREWLKQTGVLAAGAGLGSLVGPGVQSAAWALAMICCSLSTAQGRHRRAHRGARSA